MLRLSGKPIRQSRYPRIAAALFACAAFVAPSAISAARAAEPAKVTAPGIGAEASAALSEMGKALSTKEFSFQARTIRVYQDDEGQPLHIFHALKVVVRRPDRLVVRRTGDDGDNDLFYDGKTVALFGARQNKYTRLSVPDNIQAMLDEVTDRLQADFPLADLLDRDPGKAFLSGVKSGKEVDTVTIDGKPCSHLFFSQAGGIELEVWIDKSGPAVPRRLVITYRLLPGQPSFIAEFSDWNFNVHPADAEFVFQPPPGAQEVALKPIAASNSERGDKR